MPHDALGHDAQRLGPQREGAEGTACVRTVSDPWLSTGRL